MGVKVQFTTRLLKLPIGIPERFSSSRRGPSSFFLMFKSELALDEAEIKKKEIISPEQESCKNSIIMFWKM